MKKKIILGSVAIVIILSIFFIKNNIFRDNIQTQTFEILKETESAKSNVQEDTTSVEICIGAKNGEDALIKGDVDKDGIVTNKDVMIINKYISDKGKILPRRMTGACAKHQRHIAEQIKYARFMALIPYVK